MKRILLLLLTTFILADCSDRDKGFGLKVSKNLISWTNGSVRFEAEKKTSGKRNPNPAFQLYIRDQHGKEIQMPFDTYALGYGASCPMGNSGLYKPEHGISNAEILIQTPDQMVIHLEYDPWIIVDQSITLNKQITLFRDSPIMKVIDYYDGIFELLNIAAGLSSASTGNIKEIDEGFAIEYPHGVTATIIMPGVEEKTKTDAIGSVFVRKAISSGEPLRYYVGISDKGLDYLLDELDKIL